MTAALSKENITIDDADVRLAVETPRPQGATLVLRDPDGAEIQLPSRLQRMLLATLDAVAETGEASISRLPEELTSTVAAEILGISRPTLMKWAREGRLSGFKVGSHTRFKRDEVLALREKRKSERRAAFAALREEDGDWD